MANIIEQAEWSPTVFLIDTSTPVRGGTPDFDSNGNPTSGFSNAQAKQLADRTAYLKETLDNTEVDVTGLTGRVTTVETGLTAHIGSRGAAHTNATTTEAGFMSATDKTKLNGIAAGAQVNVATNLSASYSTTTANVISSTGTTAQLNSATTSLAGVMSSADKTKLDGIATGAQVNAVISVAAKTGAVTLVKGDVGLGNADNTADTAKPVSTAQQTALNLKANLSGDTFTGQILGTQAHMGGFIDKYLNNATATGTVNLACGTQSVFNLTLTGATTLAISSMPTFAANSEILTIVVRINQGASAQTLNWFSGITWLTSGGTAPATPTANKTVEYIFTNIDSTGAAWVGRLGASN